MLSSPIATVSPARRLAGRIRVPGDKSISHRYAIVSALSEGVSRLTGFSTGADCRSTLDCLRGLGISIREEDGTLLVEGNGLGGFLAPRAALDAGNSGSTMRMLAGVLAAQPFTSILSGDASLSRRPMRRVIDPLARMGARIDSTDGHAPLTIHGTSLRAADHAMTVPSAQVKSALLFAGLHADGQTSVTEPAHTRNHTERALAAFGFEVRVEGLTVTIAGGQRGMGHTFSVPGDFSSAAFWMVAAAALPGSHVEIEDVGLNPTRTGLIDVLRRFGARVDVRETGAEAGEPRGTIVVDGDRTGSVIIGPDVVPGLIAELPAIAARAAPDGEVHVAGASELRVMESDRISALAEGLGQMGAAVEERPDGLTVEGGHPLKGATLNAHDDHRIAMALSVAGLRAEGETQILGAECASISFPQFYEYLRLATR
jgi:3-phosphoshikimate 1-carboxyvinyltransferase